MFLMMSHILEQQSIQISYRTISILAEVNETINQLRFLIYLYMITNQASQVIVPLQRIAFFNRRMIKPIWFNLYIPVQYICLSYEHKKRKNSFDETNPWLKILSKFGPSIVLLSFSFAWTSTMKFYMHIMIIWTFSVRNCVIITKATSYLLLHREKGVKSLKRNSWLYPTVKSCQELQKKSLLSFSSIAVNLSTTIFFLYLLEVTVVLTRIINNSKRRKKERKINLLLLFNITMMIIVLLMQKISINPPC